MESMNYKGVIIEESLQDKTVLKKLKIISTNVEVVTEKHQTPYLNQWTLHTVEIHSDWYVDYKNDQYHYIIYPYKVFKVDLKNPVLYRAAKQYGISLGIPEYQVVE